MRPLPGPSGAWRPRCGAPAEARGRAYDAMIAAIALANGLPLYTCNPRDFAGIDGLEVLEAAARRPASCRPPTAV